jgi:chromosomal replication initiator protein
VVGDQNRLAHAAASAIAQEPGARYNPFFIYGGVGLGKTHLLHAIGNYAQAHGSIVLYCSSEQFTNDLINSIRSQKTDEFRDKYRQVDVLLIDDIQFLDGKERTQEEFFHTFNHLHAAGGQVVLSSDRPPKALGGLEERLRSRFEGGLQADIQPPDFETRVAILQKKANRLGVPIDPQVLMFVAERIDTNIRELEGALNRLHIQSQMSNQPLTYDLAVQLMDNLAPQRKPCSPDGVVRIVALHFNLTPEELTGRGRSQPVAHARHVAMYLLRAENGLSYPRIGRVLGGRDHSTIRHGVTKMEKDIAEDNGLRAEIARLRDRIYLPYAK